MRASLLPQPLLWLLLATTSSAQQVANELSFGHSGQISPNGRGIPGYSVKSSNNHQVQVLSDRVILTPPVPGNVQASLWADKSISTETWSAELEFRASGQDGGSGNLNLWFVKDKAAVAESSVYNIGKFDGLALVVDQYGSKGGSVRGFLNDGSQNYASKGNQESLAFGHCDYSYRNLGRPSKLKVTSHDGLTVSIDGQPCFSSPQISLPAGYYFGITARTPENPDSFEVNKFAVSTGIPHEHRNVVKGAPGGLPQRQRGNNNDSPQLQRLDRSHFPGAPEAVPDSAADDIRSSEAQFADLHNRLQGLTHQIANVFGEFDTLAKKIDERHNQVLAGMPAVPNQKIDEIGRRLENLERSVEGIKKSVEGNDYKEHLSQLNAAIEGVKGGLAESLPENIGNRKFRTKHSTKNSRRVMTLIVLLTVISASAPRMGMFVFVVVAVQVMMAGAYIIYKRRRASMPKKYL